MRQGESEAPKGGLDQFLHDVDKKLTEMEANEPKIRAWFEVEFKNRFPELFEEKKQTGSEGDRGAGEQKIA